MAASGQSRRTMSADPRAQRTRALLRQALMQLLEQVDWGAISTSDICRRAGIARSSFYEHYRGKADLLDEVFDERMGAIRLSGRDGDPLGTLSWLVAHVAEAPAFFAQAMAGGRGDALMPRFRAALTRQLERELRLRQVPDAACCAAYLIAGSMAYLAATPGAAGGAAAEEALQRLAQRVLGSG